VSATVETIELGPVRREGRLVDAFPVYRDVKVVKARTPTTHDLAFRGGGRIGETSALLDRLGIKAPYLERARELFDRTIELYRGRARSKGDIEAEADVIARDVGRGGLTIAEGDEAVVIVAAAKVDQEALAQTRIRLRDRAALISWRETCGELREHADELLADLRAVHEAVLDAAAKRKGRHADPDLSERYEDVHRCARVLRGWVHDGLDGTLGPGAWRYRDPRAAHYWRLDQAGQPQRRGSEVRAFARVQGASGDTTLVYRRSIGVTETLIDILAHRDDWRPDVLTAAEVLAVSDAIHQTQDLA